MKKILILGGDSAIGTALYNSLKKHNQVSCTTRKSLSAVDEKMIFLDASNVGNSIIDFSDVDIFINLIAYSKFDDCLQRPNEARLINIDFPLSIAKKASKKNARFIQFSTSAVLPCISPRQPSNIIGLPSSMYGKQKREAEVQLLALGFEIFRISKVLLPHDIIGGMRARLSNGHRVDVFTDLYLCPLSLSSVVEAVGLIIEKGRSNLYQLSADEDLSYEEVLRMIAANYGYDQKLINPISCEGLVHPDHVLRYTTMQVSKLFQNCPNIELKHQNLIQQVYGLV